MSPAPEGLTTPSVGLLLGKEKGTHIFLLQATPLESLQSNVFYLPHLVHVRFPFCPFLATGQGTKCYGTGMLLKRPRGARSKALFHSSAPGLPVYLALLLWVLKFEATFWDWETLLSMKLFSSNTYFFPQLDNEASPSKDHAGSFSCIPCIACTVGGPWQGPRT